MGGGGVGGFCTGGSPRNWEQWALNPHPFPLRASMMQRFCRPVGALGSGRSVSRGSRPWLLADAPLGADTERQSCIMFRRTGRGGQRENAIALPPTPGGTHLADTAGLGRASTPATRPAVSDRSVRPTVGMVKPPGCVDLCGSGRCISYRSNWASKAMAEGLKLSFLTNWQASMAPNSRSMRLSSHSTESGPL